MWTLDEALTLIREHQAFARECDYNLALAGGVLNTGQSTNDLDILAVPRSANRQPNETPLVERIFGGPNRALAMTDVYDGEDDELAGRILYRGQINDKNVDLIVIDFAWVQWVQKGSLCDS